MGRRINLGRKIESDHPTKGMASHLSSVRQFLNWQMSCPETDPEKDYRICWGFPLVAAEVIGSDQSAYKAIRSLVGNGKKPDFATNCWPS